MSLRRPIVLLVPFSLIAVGLGLHDWPVDGGRAQAFADRALRPYGLSLTIQGPATLTPLPLPRLTFERARITADGGGSPLVDEGRLGIDLDPFKLLTGHAAAGGLHLAGGVLSVRTGDWSGVRARLADQVRSGMTAHPSRITVRGTRASGYGAVRDIDLDMSWPSWSASAEGSARLTWRDVPTRVTVAHFRPKDFVAGGRSPITGEVTWPEGSLAVDGTVGPAVPGQAWPSLAGQMRAETRSLPESLAWLGLKAPLSPLAGAFSLTGLFETADRSVSWTRLRLGLGQNVLEGAGAVLLGPGDAPRLSVQATLAAETLDLAALADESGQLLGRDPVPLALAPLTRGDLDLRLSAATGQIGSVQVQDLAASVLVRDAALEIAVNRARVQDGLLKGRLTLASGADRAETDMRLQGSLDRVDLGGLLSGTGGTRWLAGPVHGQFNVESSARDTAAMLARLGGRMAITVAGGAITGLDLADVVHRNGAIAPGALARRNGRTAIERAAVTLRFTDGVGEIVEAGLLGPSVGASVQGQVSLPARRLDIRGNLALRSPADPSRGLLFEVSGPWDALAARTAAHAETSEPATPAGEGALPEAFGPPDLQGLAAGGHGLPVSARAYAP
ncbi:MULTISPECIES: AsmA family protein [unclassified Methylobacterium]|jgi:AsmA protein|uniref:AsmA family protein n=1 Tax=unclassified Methylobacterium TaxID=2615210 RepID=UPI001352E6A1|nr:AsmA-like C-terminal region-containing protein [Methylobacterium sp. 2A]MWV21019.1 AsmA family protein [Methylobacterium sp. 2A]